MILKNDEEEAAGRPTSFSGFWVLKERNGARRRELRVGKWETWFWFSTFPSGAKPGCGNVGISRCLRDSQGAGERGEKLLLLFPSFHGPVISTAPFRAHTVLGATRDSILQRRSSCNLAAAIFRAHSVSLSFRAIRSSCVKLTLGFRYFSAPGKAFHFSYGVA